MHKSAMNHDELRAARQQQSVDRQAALRLQRRKNALVGHALNQLGWATVQILSPDELKHYHERVIKDMETFPEYVEGHDLNKQVLGSFGALGNPSSFHCTSVRELRTLVHGKIRPIMEEFKARAGDTLPNNMEQIIDRLAYRSSGSVINKETWHRDLPNRHDLTTEVEDVVFGGWLNLDLKSVQYFSCIDNTHRVTSTSLAPGDTGFAKFKDKRMQQHYDALRPPPKIIRPGSLLIFNERLVHEVARTRVNVDRSLRLFMGWRLTNSNTPLTPLLRERLVDQAVMPIKSGQMPRIFPVLHWVNHPYPAKPGRPSLQDLKGQFREAAREYVTMTSGKYAGEIFEVPHIPGNVKTAHMPSLKELSERDEEITMYPEYTHDEIKILNPNPLC